MLLVEDVVVARQRFDWARARAFGAEKTESARADMRRHRDAMCAAEAAMAWASIPNDARLAGHRRARERLRDDRARGLCSCGCRRRVVAQLRTDRVRDRAARPLSGGAR